MASAAKVVPIKKERTIGELIDDLAAIEEKRTAHAAAGKLLDLEKTELTTLIFNTLDAQDTLSGSSKTRRINITESEEPQTEDWEEALAWMAKNKCLHLVQHRISAPAWREIRALPKYRKAMNKIVVEGQPERYEIPGFKSVVVRKLSFTKITPK